MSYYLGIDLGTSSVKVIMLDESLEIVSSVSRSYPLYHPRPGWHEQNPEEWWQAVKEALAEVIASKVSSRDSLYVGVTGQMHGVVALDKDGDPVYPAIIWADTRTDKEVDFIKNNLSQEQQKRLANPIVDGFSAPKILWLLNHKQQLKNNIEQILLPKDYIIYKLTDEFTAEEADASATLMFDVEGRSWDQEVLDSLGISGKLLPEVRKPASIISDFKSELKDDLNLKETEVKVITAGGDAPMAAMANGIIEEGRVSINIGTAGQILTTLDKYRLDPNFRLHTLCHGIPEKWYMMAGIKGAGYCLQWWHDNLTAVGEEISYDRLTAFARKTEPAASGLIFLPYLSGERSPHMNPAATGDLFGLREVHGVGHITRAIMEGVGFAFRENLEIMKELGVLTAEIYLTGGGTRNQLWSQIIADILQETILSFTEERSSAYGAAVSAAVSTGDYSFAEALGNPRTKDLNKIQPRSEYAERYDRAFAIYKKLYRQHFGLYQELKQLQ